MSPPRPDLTSTRLRALLGRTTAAAEMAHSIEIARSTACESVFYQLDAAVALEYATRSNPQSALAGLAVGVKDLFDVQGQATRAGSKVLGDVAAADAPAVARLRAAGGVLLGRTAMNEFAFSGTGINPHFGTPRNPGDALTHRLPGGSSSGSAVAVATGAVFIGLGSDTGGSVRIPAALCGVVGFKPTTGLIATNGAVPLSTTLDTVGPIARSVRDAALAFELLAHRRIDATGPATLTGLRVGVPSTLMTDALDDQVARDFDRALRRLSQHGAKVVTFDMPLLAELAGIQGLVGFSSVEGLAWHRRHGSWAQREQIDPRVTARLNPAQSALAIDYADLLHQRTAWVAKAVVQLSAFDVLASPTVATTAPALADAAHADSFFAINATLLRNTAPINFLGGPALTLPMNAPGTLGTGLMLWGPPHADTTVLQVASAAESLLCP